MLPKLLTVKQVADQLSVHIASVYRLVDSGELPALRIRGSVRVRPEALEAYLAACAIPKPRGRTRTNYRTQPDRINELLH